MGRSPVIQRVATSLPYVAVTVDDFFTGDYRRQTAIRMLAAANAAHATLTLCPAGSALMLYERLQPAQAAEIKRLVAAGSYELCDHTFSHPVMPKVGAHGGVPAEVSEITRGAAAQQAFFGRAPLPIFRPPFGSWSTSVQEAAFAAGYPQIITWSIDTGDSEGPEKPARQLLADAACARPGDIILMHANRNSSAQALPLILDMLRQKGLTPVGISTLLASGQPVYTTNPADMRHLYTCARSAPYFPARQ
jgi:hypothetical protein